MPAGPADALPVVVRLPSGGKLAGFPSIAGDSSSVTAATSLQAQSAAVLAVAECQSKILMLLLPLTKIVLANGRPSPTDVAEFARAAAILQPCFAMVSAPAWVPFLGDLLSLQIRSLTDLRERLHAALASDVRQAAAVVSALRARYAGVVDLFELARGFYAMVGVVLPTSPKLGTGNDPGSVRRDERLIDAFLAALATVADAPGGCREARGRVLHNTINSKTW